MIVPLICTPFASSQAKGRGGAGKHHKAHICHKTNKKNITLHVNVHGIPSHLSHGDYSGKCQVVLDLEQVGNINFGSLVTKSSGQIVLAPATITRTTSGGVFLLDGNHGPAKYIASGTPLAKYIINLPKHVSIKSSTGTSLLITDLTSVPSKYGKLDANGQQEILVGGTLHLESGFTPGEYSGAFDINVFAIKKESK